MMPRFSRGYSQIPAAGAVYDTYLPFLILPEFICLQRENLCCCNTYRYLSGKEVECQIFITLATLGNIFLKCLVLVVAPTRKAEIFIKNNYRSVSNLPCQILKYGPSGAIQVTVNIHEADRSTVFSAKWW